MPLAQQILFLLFYLLQIERLNEYVQVAESVINYIEEKLLPTINILASKIQSIIETLQVNEIEKSDLRRKLITCKGHIFKMLNYAEKYLEDVATCLSYADVDRSQVLWMKKGYKMFVGQAVSSEAGNKCSMLSVGAATVTIAGLGFATGILPVGLGVVGAVSGLCLAAVIPVMVNYRKKQKESALKSLKTYIRMLAQYSEVTVTT